MRILFAVLLSLVTFTTHVSAELVFTANLNAAQEVPTNTSTATGFGRVTLNDAETQITASVYFQGLTSPGTTVGHIHTGAAGVNGGVAFNLAPTAGQTSGSVVNATFPISAAQVTTLKASGMYFNVHTTTNTGGEIRGQIIPSTPLVATLNGAQEVPRNTTPGAGRAVVSINDVTNQALVSVNWSGVTGPLTGGHIHTGYFGSNGPVVCNLTPVAATAGSVTDFLCSFSAAQIASLKRGQFYLNLHTAGNPGGEIRGQLVPQNALLARLVAAQENPPNSSTAVGFGMVEVDDVANTALVNVSWTGLTGSATVGHIHAAEIGTNGPVTCNVSPALVAAGSVDNFTCNFTAAQITTLKNGGMYFNIHTAANPGGEIRGQINALLRDGYEDVNNLAPFGR